MFLPNEHCSLQGILAVFNPSLPVYLTHAVVMVDWLIAIAMLTCLCRIIVRITEIMSVKCFECAN